MTLGDWRSERMSGYKYKSEMIVIRDDADLIESLKELFEKSSSSLSVRLNICLDGQSAVLEVASEIHEHADNCPYISSAARAEVALGDNELSYEELIQVLKRKDV
jgi:hypothetical protein